MSNGIWQGSFGVYERLKSTCFNAFPGVARWKGLVKQNPKRWPGRLRKIQDCSDHKVLGCPIRTLLCNVNFVLGGGSKDDWLCEGDDQVGKVQPKKLEMPFDRSMINVAFVTGVLEFFYQSCDYHLSVVDDCVLPVRVP